MSNAMLRAGSERRSNAATIPRELTALVHLAPDALWREASDDALRMRLDLLRMTAGERQAALNALLAGRDLGIVLLRLGRMARRLFGATSGPRRVRRSSSYRNLFRTQRERSTEARRSRMH